MTVLHLSEVTKNLATFCKQRVGRQDGHRDRGREHVSITCDCGDNTALFRDQHSFRIAVSIMWVCVMSHVLFGVQCSGYSVQPYNFRTCESWQLCEIKHKFMDRIHFALG